MSKMSKRQSKMGKSTKSAKSGKSANTKKSARGDRSGKGKSAMKRGPASSKETSAIAGEKERSVSPSLRTMADRTTKKPPRKRRPRTPRENVVLIVVIAVIVAIIIAAIILGILYGGGFLPLKGEKTKEKEDTGGSGADLPQMGDLCRKLYGTCSYFPSKYVSSCQSELCHNLNITPIVDEYLERRGRFIRLSFKYLDETQPIEPPNETPCGPENWCQEKECVTTQSVKVKDYKENFRPRQGGWSEDESLTCVGDLSDPKNLRQTPPTKPILNWPEYLEKKLTCQKDGCEPYRLKLRSCIKPHPAQDGSVCWTTKGDEPLKITEWPVFMSKDASCTCEKPEDPLNCERYLYFDNCRIDKFEMIDNRALTDGRQCCYNHSQLSFDDPFGLGVVGYCLMGTCLVLL